MKISVVQPGARLHYAMPAVFAKAGLLERLYTDLHADHAALQLADKLLPDRAKPRALRRLFGRRLPQDLPAQLVHDRPMETLLRTGAAMAGFSGAGPACVTQSLLADLERAPLGEGDVVYTVIINEDIDTMRRLKERGVKIVHECIIGPDVGPLLIEEHRRFPDLGPAPDEQAVSQGRARDAEKYAVSDLVLVPSHFTEKAVVELAPKNTAIAQVPYGFELGAFAGANTPIPGRALCVGTVGRRKGHPDLAAAARLLAQKNSRAKIRVVGPDNSGISAHPAMAGPDYVGQVPRSVVAQEYGSADFFVLPTICDSFGIVIVEAMAMGLPVITTENCGDIVRDGVDGFVVPIRDPNTLAARIEELTEDRDLRDRMSQAARERALSFNQDAYSQRLLAAMQRFARPETFQAGATPLTPAMV